VDLGAHIGASVVYFKDRRPEALVHGYEADPGTYAKLRRNAGSLPGVVLHPEAIAAHDGETAFYSSPQSWCSSLLRREEPGARERVVPCRRLATARREAGLAEVDLLKLDVEGAEFEILADPGALDGVRAVVGELHFDLRTDRRLEDVLAALGGFGVELAGDSRERMTLVAARRATGA
jgi:FkbM family methyltransferase